MTKEFCELFPQWEGKQVAVLSHMRPDGDSIGSQVALCRVLNALGVQAYCVMGDTVPRILRPFIEDTPHCAPDAHPWAATITVDCADPFRIGTELGRFFKNITLNIDHHITNTQYAAHNYVEGHTVATAEYLAHVFLENKLPVDVVTARALYMGIVTDSGNFMFSATTSRTLRLAARLVDMGVSPGDIGGLLSESESWARLQLIRAFLSSLRIVDGGRICFGQLTLADYAAAGAERADAEHLVDYARSLESVSVGILFDEMKDGVKVSVRCKDPKMCIHEFASLFGGGGHFCAAGFSVKNTSIAALSEQVLARMSDYLNQVEAKSI